jgi:hypothetical protein
MEFKEFPKIYRLHREIIVTEKLDGTNASIFIGEDGTFLTGSRTRWITPEDDNFGFSKWAHENKQELMKLGPGTHFGEWYGKGIQRNYGMSDKRFALFNTMRWSDSATRPICCEVVPVLYQGVFNEDMIMGVLTNLKVIGSRHVTGFMKPEGIVIYHIQGNLSFKKTIDKDNEHKGQ